MSDVAVIPSHQSPRNWVVVDYVVAVILVEHWVAAMVDDHMSLLDRR